MKKEKLLIGIVLLSSLIGYLQWGPDQETYLFQAEWELVQKLTSDPFSVLHPFTLIPFFGQICLLISLVQKSPPKAWVFLGIGSIGVLILMILFVGILSLNIKIILSTFPFLIFSTWIIWKLRNNLKTEK